MHLTNGEPRAAEGRLPSQITQLIARLCGAVTDSHAYFIVLKYFNCLRRCRGCNVEKLGQTWVLLQCLAWPPQKPRNPKVPSH